MHFIETIESLGSDPAVMKWTGGVILALLGFGFMRLRKQPMSSSLAFGAGILGIMIVLNIIKHIF